MKLYFLGINILEFSLMGLDKFLATKKKQRISEITLLTINALGGSIGGILGMSLFHHKNKKLKFKILFFFFLFFHLLIFYLKK